MRLIDVDLASGRRPMTWHEFETAAPELAGLGRERFAATGVALLGTLRRWVPMVRQRRLDYEGWWLHTHSWRYPRLSAQ